MDIVVALPLLILTSPLLLVVVATIRIGSRGPAFFRAQRVGRAGREFTMYKFRSMERDAELRLQDYAHLNLSSGMVKIAVDPRVTRFGKFLRRFSLDEMPQLWNVVKGDMSLVGPRPHDRMEVFPDLDARDPVLYERLSMRPGLTGIWQVTARSDPSLATRVLCDLTYVRNWSLWLDARLLAATVPVVVLGQGGQVHAHSNSPQFVDTKRVGCQGVGLRVDAGLFERRRGKIGFAHGNPRDSGSVTLGSADASTSRHDLLP